MAALAFEKMFQAVGRMKVTMAALIFGCVCNILLDPILIFGLGPVPAMGIAGAALATGIGQLLSLCVYLFVYVRTELPIRLRRSCLRPDAALDGKLYAIGVPAILNLALPSLLVTFLNGLLAGFSPGVGGGGGILLQAADVPVSARQRHRAGYAPAHWLQLRCQTARPREKSSTNSPSS